MTRACRRATPLLALLSLGTLAGLAFLEPGRVLIGPVAAATNRPPVPGPAGSIAVAETDDAVTVETDALAAAVRKHGYVSGLAEGSLLDRKTGARDVGFGLHIMDFLMSPGWRDDGYTRDRAVHGDLPKHYVEGPQICTQAKKLPLEVIRGDGFVAVRTHYTFHEPGAGYQAGSTWRQTLVFQPGVRYVVSAEEITSANDADNLFYRIDMPGHVKHGGARPAGDTFEQIYLSYGGADHAGQTIPASEFARSFAPDEKFLYLRDDARVPSRMIRAYQVKPDGGKPGGGPWLAGMTLDPAAVSEAWCHERGYVCFIQELHGRPVKAGETLGAAYVVGWFDDVKEMETVYDAHKGKRRIVIEDGKWRLE